MSSPCLLYDVYILSKIIVSFTFFVQSNQKLDSYIEILSLFS